MALGSYIKYREEQKAKKNIILISVIYIPLLFIEFFVVYHKIIKHEIFTVPKYMLFVTLLALLTAIFIGIIQKFINKKYFVRDKKEFKNGLIFSYLIYIVFQLLTIAYLRIDFEAYAIDIAFFIIANGTLLYIFVTDYDTANMGIYTDRIGDYVFYNIERKFSFKNELTEQDFEDSMDPLQVLTDIIKEQTDILAMKDDLKHLGKYPFYFVQSYKYDDKYYVCICYSETGKKCNKVISVNNAYSEEIYDERLEHLNNAINIYSKHD